jgi:hypothetical protein
MKMGTIASLWRYEAEAGRALWTEGLRLSAIPRYSQRRFAPLCLTCVIWRYTTMSVDFEHDLVAIAYKLNDVVALHGVLSTTLTRSRSAT